MMYLYPTGLPSVFVKSFVAPAEYEGDGAYGVRGGLLAGPTMPFDVAAIIQTFRERSTQPELLVSRLIDTAAAASISVQILVNDDSGEQQAAWLRHMRTTDVYLQSPNIHEVRAYNTLAARANSSLLVFLQGDNCLPT